MRLPRPRLLRRLLSVLLLCSCAGICVRGLAEDTSSLSAHDAVQLRSFRAYADANYTRMSVSGTTLSGAGVGGTLLYALSPKVSAGFSLRQSFTSSFNAFFTEFDLQARYALTGSLRLESESLSLGDSDVLNRHTDNAGGFQALGFLHEYLINTTGSVLPYPGVGIGAAYDFPSSDLTNYGVGIRVDRASNGTTTFYPIQIFFTVGLWL